MAYQKKQETIEYSYNGNELMRHFLDVGNQLVPMAIDEGAVAIEARDTVFPFIDNKGDVDTRTIQFLFDSAYNQLRAYLNSLIPIEGNDSVEITSIIKLSISYGAYKDNAIEYLDTFIRNCLVYGALYEWFTECGAETLIKASKELIDEEMLSAEKYIREMALKLNRIPLRNPFNFNFFETH